MGAARDESPEKLVSILPPPELSGHRILLMHALDACEREAALVEFPEEVASEHIVTWPLERDIAEFAENPVYLQRDSGERISAPADAAASRELRTLFDFGYDPPAAFSMSGDLYFFWLRDELPPEVEAKLTALLEAE